MAERLPDSPESMDCESAGTRAHAAEGQIAHLELALQHRSITSAAVGILMERYDIDYETAFATLRRVSSLRNEKVFNLAVELLDTRQLDGLPEHPGGR